MLSYAYLSYVGYARVEHLSAYRKTRPSLKYKAPVQ